MNSPRPVTLPDALGHQAQARGEHRAFTYLPGFEAAPRHLSFGELDDSARRLASRIARVTRPGDTVLVLLPACPEFMVACFACGYAGVACVPYYPPKSGTDAAGQRAINGILEASGARLILSLENLIPFMLPALEASGAVCWALDNPAATPQADRLANSLAMPGSVALLLFTSGSTGSPKGVALTHANLVSNLRAFVSAFDLSANDTMVTWLPNCHIAGLYTRLLGVFTGAATVVFAPALFLERPLFWLETIHRYRGVISAAPNFAYDLCRQLDPAEGANLNLGAWRLAISGGEVVRPATCEGFSRRFAVNGLASNAMVPYYGLTETLCTTTLQGRPATLVKVARAALAANRAEPPARGELDFAEFMSNGRPLGDTRVVVVDPTTRERCAEEMIGEVWVAGSNVTPGYWRQAELNREVVQGRLAPEGDGPFFRTGDLGFLRKGELFITGRLKELIIIRGKNFYPADLEAAVLPALAKYGIKGGATFAFERDAGEKLGLVVEAPGALSLEPDEFLALVQSRLAAATGLRADACVLLRDRPLPRTATGKVQRGVCRQQFLAGAWDSQLLNGTTPAGTGAAPSKTGTEHEAAPPADREGIARWLGSQVAGLLGTAGQLPPTAGRPLAEIGLDSLGAVRLLGRVNERFGIRFDFGRLLGAESLNDLAMRILTARARPTGEAVAPLDYATELRAIRDQLATPLPERNQDGAVFLTGATGFLGAYLLRDLAATRTGTIWCLVRATSPAEGRRRLQAKLASLPGWQSEWLDRIQVACGSLEQPDFGLEPRLLEQLAHEVSVIIHNGANVNFVASYEQLRPVNVTSNLNVLRLATRARLKAVHYISTVAVFNGPERDSLPLIKEADSLTSPARLFSGYAQTKWVSETMWREAAARGVPVTLFRPGLVTGDSAAGYWHTDDFLCRFIKGCLQFGCFPDLPIEVDMSPVDFVSGAIACLGAGAGAAGKTFHLVNPSPIRLPDLAHWFAASGWPVALEDSETWHRRLGSEMDEDNALFPLYPFLLQPVVEGGETILEFFGRRRLNLDQTNTLNGLRDQEPACPAINDRLLRCYTRHLINTGFLPAPARQTETCQPTPAFC